MADKARIKDGTLAAAWNRGEYCFTSISVISQLPYVGMLWREAESLVVLVYGS